MFSNHSSIISKKRSLLWVILLLLLFMAMLSACGGQSKQAALSKQAPPRRGAVDVLAEVQDITAEILGVPADKVVEQADFRKDLGANDEAMARLGDAFAKNFGVILSKEEIDGLTTVRSAVDLIESKQSS